ncbi:MAG: type II toxin-antitoxin system Phd/YefM family antitoxin [Propionibacteriaceae bacterium]|nr:type II toxin-antitoxin system Phd/YefM family antitoxin [Propionibacteriaceae bacterium]
MSWQVQEAKQRFSEVLRLADSDGDQIITRQGVEVAAIVDIDEYRKLKQARRESQYAGIFPPLGDDEIADALDTVVAQRHAVSATSRTIPDFGE